jgi:hypothetical protein
LINALQKAAPEPVPGTFDFTRFIKRAGQLGYDNLEAKRLSIENLFSSRSFVKRINRFGKSAVADLAVVCGLSDLQHSFLDALLFSTPIAEDGSINSVKISEVEAVMGAGDLRFIKDAVAHGLSAESRNYSKVEAILARGNMAEIDARIMEKTEGRGIDARIVESIAPALRHARESVWGMLSITMRGQISFPNLPLEPFSSLKFDFKSGLIEFQMCANCLQFLRVRQRVLKDWDSLEPKSAEAKTAVNDFVDATKATVNVLNQLAEALGIEKTNTIEPDGMSPGETDSMDPESQFPRSRMFTVVRH